MSLLKALLDRLPNLRRAQEFADIIPDLENRLMLVQAAADDLREDLKRALFASPEKCEAVRKDIAANLAEQDDLALAISGARERQKEAANDELAAEVERRVAAARHLQATLHSSGVKLHEALSRAATSLTAIKSATDELWAVNNYAREHGRSDLVITNPIDLIFSENPGNAYEHPYHQIQIPGYYPASKVSSLGPALGKMKALKT